jgi:ABC-type thiamin/hydroxymethylpyrimidine transport system permease subunit
MARRFHHIPRLTGTNQPEVVGLLVDAVGFMAGQTTNVVAPLPPAATLAEVVAKVNEVIARLQGT